MAAGAFWYGAILMGILACVSFVFIAVVAFVFWRLLERIDAYAAFQILLVLTFFATLIDFAGIQFLSNPETQKFLRWTPQAWCMLALFPLLSLQFWWIRRSFQRDMQKWQR